MRMEMEVMVTMDLTAVANRSEAPRDSRQGVD